MDFRGRVWSWMYRAGVSCARQSQRSYYPIWHTMAPQPVPRDAAVTLRGHKGAVNVARYSRGAASYVLSGGQDRVIKLWNAKQGAEIKTFAAHGYEVLSITVCVHSLVLWICSNITQGPRQCKVCLVWRGSISLRLGRSHRDHNKTSGRSFGQNTLRRVQ